MPEKGFYERLNASASDFVRGVQPAMESQFGIFIHPVEDMGKTELMKKLDQKGIDAFYYNKNLNQKGLAMRGLASRMNYSSAVKNKPAFSFRYKLWNPIKKQWDSNREYSRKLYSANNSNDFSIFPKIHVESFSKSRGSGKISWSFFAETKNIVNYIEKNLEDKSKVRVFEPKQQERRQVVSVDIEEFAKSEQVWKVKL